VSTIKAPPIYKIIVSQFIAVVFITAAGYVTRDLIVAYSLLLGGLICAVPNAYFTLRAFRYRGASATQQIVRDFYVGEGIKLLLIGSGFALVFSSVDPLNALALFAGFVLVFVVGLAALIFIQTKHVDT
jgi:ATP synthase protein I